LWLWKTPRYNWQLYEAETILQYMLSRPCTWDWSEERMTAAADRKVDAERIQVRTDECTLWKPTPVNIQKIKVLLGRTWFNGKNKKAVLGRRHDYKLMDTIGLKEQLTEMNRGNQFLTS
jgi:hypothetical protein